MEKVYVPDSPHEKAMQRALIQYRNPDNYDLVYEALKSQGRDDLIGFGPKCLIKPRKMAGNSKTKNQTRGTEKPGLYGDKRRKTQAGKPEAQGREKSCAHKKKKTIRNTHKPKK